ncbi:MAG TPA: hypothetical protein VF245_12620 [Solirubrobacterales bacterium]
MRRHYAVVLCALLLLVGVGAVAAASTHHAGEGRCFSAAKWDASDGLRPCVEVTRIYEDGSFTYRVSDANGTERYTSGVGALDR